MVLVGSGGMKMPAYVESTYGASIVEWDTSNL
jgi:hypothetical protein